MMTLLNIKIKAEDIKDYKFGIKWLKGLQFTIGREYQIIIRTYSNNITPIKFKTFYGYKKQYFSELYENILSSIWKKYFCKIADSYIERFYNYENFSLCNVLFEKEGVTIKVDKTLKSVDTFIQWEDIRTMDYYTYFVIYSNQNPNDISGAFYYQEDWNITVLYSVIRTILKKKNIEDYNI